MRLVWRCYHYREIQKRNPLNVAAGVTSPSSFLWRLTQGREQTICRTGFEPELGRPWIDLGTGVLYRRRQGQREMAKRSPPIKLPARLLAHLRRWKDKGICRRNLVEWNGEGVKAIEKAFRNVVLAAGLDLKVIPHSLRHTTASWGMQNGADHGALADYLGMTVEMLRRVYGHHDPRYLADAREAISSRPRQLSDRMAAVARRGAGTFQCRCAVHEPAQESDAPAPRH